MNVGGTAYKHQDVKPGSIMAKDHVHGDEVLPLVAEAYSQKTGKQVFMVEPSAFGCGGFDVTYVDKQPSREVEQANASRD